MQTFLEGNLRFEDGDKFRYPTTELLRATATKLGSCDKHRVTKTVKDLNPGVISEG